jgi:hypothetical protein
MDQGLNIGFFVVHTVWICFTCIGWLWRRTRPLQLAMVLATALSWFGLGLRYGWGYCPCTDWHWQVRARLGFNDPPSYVQLLIRQLTGIDLTPEAADTLAVVTLAGAGLAGTLRHIRDRTGSSGGTG